MGELEMKLRFNGGGGRKLKNSVVISNARSSSPMRMWLWRALTTLVIWSCIVHLVTPGEMWDPRLWTSCFSQPDPPSPPIDVELTSLPPKTAIPPKRIYRNNGYLMVSCNGGLNQMRAAICDMVAIARFLNVTLIVPELDKTSFWKDPSDFKDIFNVRHFIDSLRGEVRVLTELPPRLKQRVKAGNFHSLQPVSWSNLSYYRDKVLPLVRKHKVLHLMRTDARLANNGIPIETQKLRCRVNFNALRFTPEIEELGRKVVRILREKGPFLVLHLRYEMDMLAFSGCNQGCNTQEIDELARMRYGNPWWKEKEVDSDANRQEGLCPLTPEETALLLQALGVDRNVQIYIAAGEIYGGKRRMAALAEAFPNLVRKETLLDSSELMFFQNHSSQMAALDYLVSLESDIFIPTYDGNMAKVAEGHRRFLGFKKTILLNRKHLVALIDQYDEGSLSWDEFSSSVKETHADCVASPKARVAIPDKPKKEDYFYANPHECLQLLDEPLRSSE